MPANSSLLWLRVFAGVAHSYRQALPFQYWAQPRYLAWDMFRTFIAYPVKAAPV